jgi:hypothetical protein
MHGAWRGARVQPVGPRLRGPPPNVRGARSAPLKAPPAHCGTHVCLCGRQQEEAADHRGAASHAASGPGSAGGRAHHHGARPAGQARLGREHRLYSLGFLMVCMGHLVRIGELSATSLRKRASGVAHCRYRSRWGPAARRRRAWWMVPGCPPPKAARPRRRRSLLQSTSQYGVACCVAHDPPARVACAICPCQGPGPPCVGLDLAAVLLTPCVGVSALPCWERSVCAWPPVCNVLDGRCQVTPVCSKRSTASMAHRLGAAAASKLSTRASRGAGGWQRQARD